MQGPHAEFALGAASNELPGPLDPAVWHQGRPIPDHKVLGRGGFGITYLVRDEGLEKDFALKEFFPEDLVRREGTSIRFTAKPNSEADYRWGLKKFYDEARLLAQFNHSNIVNVRRVFEANNSAYMLLDFVNGRRWSIGCRGSTARPRRRSWT